MKFKVVSEQTGQPIGFGLSVVRQLAHIVDAVICYVGFLFPLWDCQAADHRRQDHDDGVPAALRPGKRLRAALSPLR